MIHFLAQGRQPIPRRTPTAARTLRRAEIQMERAQARANRPRCRTNRILSPRAPTHLARTPRELAPLVWVHQAMTETRVWGTVHRLRPETPANPPASPPGDPTPGRRRSRPRTPPFLPAESRRAITISSANISSDNQPGLDRKHHGNGQAYFNSAASNAPAGFSFNRY